MANEFYIGAGLVPIDNSTGATANSFYISAGLVPDDTVVAGGGFTKNIMGVTASKIEGLATSAITKVNGVA